MTVNTWLIYTVFDTFWFFCFEHTLKMVFVTTATISRSAIHVVQLYLRFCDTELQSLIWSYQMLCQSCALCTLCEIELQCDDLLKYLRMNHNFRSQQSCKANTANVILFICYKNVMKVQWIHYNWIYPNKIPACTMWNAP